MYYYVLGEYRVSNELLTEDIYVRNPPFPFPFAFALGFPPLSPGRKTQAD